MNFILVIIAISIIILIGKSILTIINLNIQKSAISNISLAWALGVGVISFQLFIYSRLGISWTRELILLLWLPFIFYYSYKQKFNLNKLNLIPKLNVKEIFLLIFIFTTLIYTFSQAIIRPLTAWDTWAAWLFEAKVFFIEGGIIPQLFNEFDSDYPLVYKLLGSFIYIFLGKVDDTAILLLSFAFYFFLGLMLFTYLKHTINCKIAILFTFLLLSNQVMVRLGGRIEAGLADLPLAFYILLSTIIIFEYFKEKKIKFLIIANILLGILSLVKYDGIPFAIVSQGFLIYFIFKNKLYKQLWVIIIWFIPLFDWFIYRHINNLQSAYFKGHPLQMSLAKTIYAFIGTFQELINIRSWGLTWILYMISHFVFKYKNKIESVFLNSQIIIQVAIYLTLYIFTFGNAPNSSIQRLLAHIFPLVLLYFSFQKELIQRLNKIF